jgi:hypothetical protein
MGDKMRWRYGDTNTVSAAVDKDTVIEIGDLLWQDVDDAKPFSRCPTYDLVVAKFLGVAMQRSRAGETAPVRVATTGVFEFDCEPCAFELGDLIGPCIGRPDPDAVFFNQQVTRYYIPTRAIGRAARRTAFPATCVLVDIRSTVMTGGVLFRPQFLSL